MGSHWSSMWEMWWKMVRLHYFASFTFAHSHGWTAQSVIHMYGRKHSCAYVMNVTSVLMEEGALSVVHLVCALLCHLRSSRTYWLPRSIGISDAYYCAECTRLEKDRDGCPKIVNLGASRTDLFYERRRLGEHAKLCYLRYWTNCQSRFQERLVMLRRQQYDV